MSTATQIGNKLQKVMERFSEGVVNNLTDNVQKSAKSNFRSFEIKASTDFPKVDVWSTGMTKTGTAYERQVVCGGTQVLFIEFGVGSQNQFVADKNGEMTKPAIGFDFWTGAEVMPRPNGIVQLGRYGKGHGLDAVWVRPSVTGIPNEAIGESLVRDYPSKKSGLFAIWTHGHPPARALWRARTSALRKLSLVKILREVSDD